MNIFRVEALLCLPQTRLPCSSRCFTQSCPTLWSQGLQHTKFPCPSLSPRVFYDSCPSSRWCHPAISSSVVPFSSCLQSFPASGSFPMTQFFASGGQNVGVSVSASVLPMNIQIWFPLGLTGLILQSKGVFSSTTIQTHQFLGIWPSYSPTLISVHDYWKNHSFGYMDIYRQSDVSAF